MLRAQLCLRPARPASRILALSSDRSSAIHAVMGWEQTLPVPRDRVGCEPRPFRPAGGLCLVHAPAATGLGVVVWGEQPLRPLSGPQLNPRAIPPPGLRHR